MGDMSNEPSWRCETGMESGDSSAFKTDVKALRAPMSVDSGA